MSRIMEPSPEQFNGWNEWVAERPENVRIVVERFDPWSLYRMNTTGQRVTVRGFDEGLDGSITARVHVSGDHNLVHFERTVFGVNPDDLEPCDPPGPDVPTGAAVDLNAMSPDEVELFFADLHVDLAERGFFDT